MMNEVLTNAVYFVRGPDAVFGRDAVIMHYALVWGVFMGIVVSCWVAWRRQ